MNSPLKPAPETFSSVWFLIVPMNLEQPCSAVLKIDTRCYKLQQSRIENTRQGKYHSIQSDTAL